MGDETRRWVRTGWARAFAGALIAGAVGLAVAELAAFGFALASGAAGPAISVARAGLLLFYAFHHVPLSFGAGITSPSGVGVAHVRVILAAAPMLGTLVVGGALFLVGRSLARTANEPTDGSGGGMSVAALAAAGAKVALPYAVLCAAAVPIARLTVTPTGSARVLLQGAFTVGPAILPGFVWALVLGAVAGALGGVTTWRPQLGAAPRAAAAVVGGSLMALIGVVLAFAGLLVMAAVDNHATRAYLGAAFRGGPSRGAAVVALTALEVPNMATWVLYPSMGSCIAVAQASGTAGATQAARTSSGGACVLSFRRSPTSAALSRAGSLGRAVAPASANVPATPPASYLLFLLVPTIAVLAGGWVAARRSARLDGPGRLSAGASAGAVAGVVFVAWAPLLILLSTISVTVGGSGAAGLGGEGTVAVGPPLLLSVGVAAAWGLVGGAAGGTLQTLVSRRSDAPVRERVFPEGTPGVE